MEFRKAVFTDIKNIMSIIKDGQDYLKEQGVNQWQNNYPNREVIKNDIDNEYSYIIEEGSNLLATVAISFDGEITYNQIHDGQWLSSGDYGVIHRMAIHREKRGSQVSSFMMKSIELLCIEKNIMSIKVDTHRKNTPMQQYLKKNDFKYCGLIYLSDGDERLAYEKILVR